MRLVRRALCHLDGSGIKEGARSLEPRFHVGKGELGRLEIRDGLAELLAVPRIGDRLVKTALSAAERACADRSEEHTSELHSLMRNLVCRLLLENKKSHIRTSHLH